MISLKAILVATDFGEASDAALVYGRTLARTFGATLHVVHVTESVYITTFGAETYTAMAPELQRDLDESARKQLNELLIDSDGSNPPTISAIMTSNNPAAAIVEYAKDKHVDLIITGTHGRAGVAHMVLGSVAERVVRSAPCPVLTVRHPEHEFVQPDTLTTVANA